MCIASDVMLQATARAMVIAILNEKRFQVKDPAGLQQSQLSFQLYDSLEHKCIRPYICILRNIYIYT